MPLALFGCKKRVPWYTRWYTVKTVWFRPRYEQPPALPSDGGAGRVRKSVIPEWPDWPEKRVKLHQILECQADGIHALIHRWPGLAEKANCRTGK
jgi:hypothetical protein